MTKSQKSLCFLFSAFIGMLSVRSLAAADQQESEIARLLPRDTPALLEINDVATTFERLKNLPLFSDVRWLEAQQLLEEGEKPLIPSERLIKTLETLDEVESLLTKIDNLALAVHDMDNEIGTLFVSADQETLDDLQSNLTTIAGCLWSSTPIADLAKLDLENTNKSLKQSSISLQIHRFPGLLVVSNSREYMNLLNVFLGGEKRESASENETTPSGSNNEKDAEQPIDEKQIKESKNDSTDPLLPLFSPNEVAPVAPVYSAENFKSLLDSRAYRTIKKRSTRINDQTGLISMFVRPAALSRFFPNYTKDNWKGYGFHELTGAGLNFAVMPTPTDAEQPMLIADATVMFTEPKTGKALMMSHYDAVEIPHLTVKPISLMTYSRDEELYYKESLKCYDQMYGEDAGKDYFLGRYVGSDRDFYDDAIPRRSTYLALEYLSDEVMKAEDNPEEKLASNRPQFQMGWINDQGNVSSAKRPTNRRAMSFEKIKNADCMFRYVKGMLKGNPLKKFDDPDFHLWRRADKESKNNIGYLIDKASSTHQDNLTHDSYLIGNDWYVEGEWPGVRIQLEHLDQLKTDQPDYGVPLRSLVKNLLHQTKDENPIQIKYYEPEAWTKTIANMRENRFSAVNQINLEPTGKEGEYRIRVSGSRGSNRPFYQIPNNPGEDEIIDERVETIDVSGVGFPIMKLNDLELMIQNPKESNHFKAKRLVARMIADSFGRELFLYTKSDSELRIVFGCYPMPVESQEKE